MPQRSCMAPNFWNRVLPIRPHLNCFGGGHAPHQPEARRSAWCWRFHPHWRNATAPFRILTCRVLREVPTVVGSRKNFGGEGQWDGAIDLGHVDAHSGDDLPVRGVRSEPHGGGRNERSVAYPTSGVSLPSEGVHLPVGTEQRSDIPIGIVYQKVRALVTNRCGASWRQDSSEMGRQVARLRDAGPGRGGRAAETLLQQLRVVPRLKYCRSQYPSPRGLRQLRAGLATRHPHTPRAAVATRWRTAEWPGESGSLAS